MTYRTGTDKLRATYILAGVVMLAIMALCLAGNGLEACSAVQSLETCAYALR